MKSLLLSIVFSFITGIISAQVRYDIKIMSEGKLRDCIIVKPSKAPPVGGYPVVFMLHGTSGDGEKFYNVSGWKELGETENFITVFPSSLSWCFNDFGVEKNNTKWVCGELIDRPCSGPPQTYINDILFFRKIAAIIKDTASINMTKIFACGFSNGSSMIHKLAMDGGDLFAAVAGVSGPLHSLDSTTPLNRIPLSFMLGTADDRWYSLTQYPELPFGGDSILMVIGGTLKRVQVCQGLTGTYTKTETAITHTYTYNEEQLAPTASPFIFTLVKGLTHNFPNGGNFPLNAPLMFWNFFNNLPTIGVQKVGTSNVHITLFPNPSNDKIQIKVDTENQVESFNLKILNSIGQVLYIKNCKIDSDFFLEKREIGSGLFTIQIQLENRISYKKVLFN